MVAIAEKEQRRDSTAAPHASVMESLVEGWTENSRELDGRVATAMGQTAERAKHDLIRVLRVPISEPLAEHWQNLGGSLPPAVPSDLADRL